MNKVTLDANVFLKLLFKEPDSQTAIDLVSYVNDKAIKIIVPSVVINETMNSCERIKIDLAQANMLFKNFMAHNMQVVSTNIALLDKTIEITQHGNTKSGFPTFSDSLYHALAIQENSLFITADKKHKLKTEKKFKHIALLKDWKKVLRSSV